jgi:hypothetical protein
MGSMREQEVWVRLNGMDDYKISNYGRVQRLRYGKWRILKPEKTYKEYVRYGIPEYETLRPKTKKQYAHILVATHFLPVGIIGFPLRLLQVDHKDGDKTNNFVGNLEWVSRHENIRRQHRL